MKSAGGDCAGVETASPNFSRVDENYHCSTRNLSDRPACVAEKVALRFSLGASEFLAGGARLVPSVVDWSEAIRGCGHIAEWDTPHSLCLPRIGSFT